MNEERKIEIEEVEEAVKPPKARVSEGFERKRDYLAGFLAQKPEEPAPV
ncbi:MAG TPA: SUF system Fe-S cluster assembly protein, partial [Allosphingosinicella sp.]|nr:SUF system Fe-S cluster assembly protein [Allosphingosinicella sp.]